jgi:speckle-type POZ protein
MVTVLSHFLHVYFENILYIFQVDDVDFEVMREVVRFLSHGYVQNMDLLAVRLLIAADKYEIDQLKTITEKFLSSTVNSLNYVDLLAFADMYSALHLRRSVHSFIKNNVLD